MSRTTTSLGLNFSLLRSRTIARVNVDGLRNSFPTNRHAGISLDCDSSGIRRAYLSFRVSMKGAYNVLSYSMAVLNRRLKCPQGITRKARMTYFWTLNIQLYSFFRGTCWLPQRQRFVEHVSTKTPHHTMDKIPAVPITDPLNPRWRNANSVSISCGYFRGAVPRRRNRRAEKAELEKTEKTGQMYPDDSPATNSGEH